jgi:hypothetical protein
MQMHYLRLFNLKSPGLLGIPVTIPEKIMQAWVCTNHQILCRGYELKCILHQEKVSCIYRQKI